MNTDFKKNNLLPKKLPRKLSAISYQLSVFRKLTAMSHKLKAILSAKNLPPTTYHLPPSPRNLPPTTYNLQPSHGFTLIEMLVSISVFMVVMTVASGSLVSIIDGNSKAQSLKSAINNLNFALESMGKNIRVGTAYSGGANCSPADTCVIFDSYKDLNSNSNMNDDTVIYKYSEDDSINHTGLIERCETASGAPCSVSAGNFIRLTAPEVKITDMKFYISDISSPPQRVLITINGEAGTKERIKTKFNLQTTVSQRAF